MGVCVSMHANACVRKRERLYVHGGGLVSGSEARGIIASLKVLGSADLARSNISLLLAAGGKGGSVVGEEPQLINVQRDKLDTIDI